VALVLVLVAFRFGPAIGLLLGFAVLGTLEHFFRRHDFGVRRPGSGTDVLHFLFTGTLNTGALLVAAVLVWIPLHFFTIAPVADALAAAPAVVQGAIGFLLFSAFGYWYHRLSHEVPALWRFHSVHHSSEHLDWLAAARLHPIEGFLGGLVVAPPLILIGISPGALGAFSAFVTLWAVFQHANVRFRLRWLEPFWSTPEYHHWHHSDEPAARNHNYAGLLPVFDRIFGTQYRPTDRRPQVYGIGGGMPEGYLAQLAMPFRRRAR
jgi:sterol desaturase/sphingolipid hydroxylase (fatty acid hydroxylase superfamily)